MTEKDKYDGPGLYRVWLKTTASTVVEVHLESRAEATDTDKVYNKVNATLCHQCAGHVELGDFEIGEDEEDIVRIED